MNRLVDCVRAAYWLIKEEVPHTTKYCSLLSLCRELDGSGRMNLWQQTRPANATYLSHNVPGEFLNAIEEHLHTNLRDRVNPDNLNVPFVSVMADEATDLRKRTILSVCLRYLGKNGQPIEYFAGLTELNNTDAATVTDGILLILERANINPNMVMWLSFDGASNMSGKNAGTQALMINNHTKLAVYIHCRSHALQLVCVNAAQ